MKIKIDCHARIRMYERGVTRKELIKTIKKGRKSKARSGRVRYKHQFQFNQYYQGSFYKSKQVEAYTAREHGNLIIITIIVKYF